MASKPLTNDAIALTEKKMDMTLDDIIKMSKSSTTDKTKKQRIPNKSNSFLNNVGRDKSTMVRQFMDSRSSLRQGALAKRRSNFQGNQFPLTTEAARKAAAAPNRNRGFNRNRTVTINRQRAVAQPFQRDAARGGFVKRQQQQQQQVKIVPKQRPQTLDSLFANMKEQRMRTFAQQNNNNNNVRQNGSFQTRRRQRGGGRGRFTN